MTIHIRPATPADYEGVNTITRQGQDEHADALPHIFEKTDQALPSEYFTELLEGSDTTILLATEGDVVVGFSIVEIRTTSFPSLVPRTHGYISDFGVDTAHQRKGIGRQLFHASVDWAREHGVTQLELMVWEFNQGAIALYEGLGMSTLSRKMSIDI